MPALPPFDSRGAPPAPPFTPLPAGSSSSRRELLSRTVADDHRSRPRTVGFGWLAGPNSVDIGGQHATMTAIELARRRGIAPSLTRPAASGGRRDGGGAAAAGTRAVHTGRFPVRASSPRSRPATANAGATRTTEPTGEGRRGRPAVQTDPLSLSIENLVQQERQRALQGAPSEGKDQARSTVPGWVSYQKGKQKSVLQQKMQKQKALHRIRAPSSWDDGKKSGSTGGGAAKRKKGRGKGKARSKGKEKGGAGTGRGGSRVKHLAVSGLSQTGRGGTNIGGMYARDPRAGFTGHVRPRLPGRPAMGGPSMLVVVPPKKWYEAPSLLTQPPVQAPLDHSNYLDRQSRSSALLDTRGCDGGGGGGGNGGNGGGSGGMGDARAGGGG